MSWTETKTGQEVKYAREKTAAAVSFQGDKQADSHLPSVLEQTLNCRNDNVSACAYRAINWLEPLSPITRNRILERLAQKVAEIRKSGDRSLKARNCIAAIEILVYFRKPLASPIIKTWLPLRPVTESHLYLITISRTLINQSDLDRLILSCLREAIVEPNAEWKRSLIVEAFRSLAKLQARCVPDLAADYLEKIGELEMTAVLDAVSASLQSGKYNPNIKFTAAIKRIWNRYRTISASEADNVSGVLARLAEIEIYCGRPVEEVLREIAAVERKASVLYILARSQSILLGREIKSRVFAYAAETLQACGQHSSLKRLMKMTDTDCGANEGALGT